MTELADHPFLPPRAVEELGREEGFSWGGRLGLVETVWRGHFIQA